MNIHNIRTFIPSKNFQLSKQFYVDLGFQIAWEDNKLIIFGIIPHTFFLQNAYVKEWAENCMMQLHVDDLDSLYEHALALTKKYPNTKINDIFTADYGRTFHLIGPAGELWHMTEIEKSE